MIHSISGLLIGPESTLREVIAVIESNRRQFALVVDENDYLLGVITDGDIRRSMLRGNGLDTPASNIMNPQPLTGLDSESAATYSERMHKAEIRHLPILNLNSQVVGLATIDDVAAVEQVSTPVVLMAGGKGQRLFPLTKDTPKPMLPVGGTPILGIILERLRAQGFNRVYISVNYLAEIIEDYVGDGSGFGLKVSYIRENTPLGTAGALASQKGVISEPFIVMNSDLITDVNLRELLEFHHAQSATATIGVREHVTEIPFGVVKVRDGKVVELAEKPLHRSLVSAGIYVLDSSALNILSPEEYCDMPTLLSLLMDEGKSVTAFPIHEAWLDVGRPEDLNRARLDANPDDDAN